MEIEDKKELRNGEIKDLKFTADYKRKYLSEIRKYPEDIYRILRACYFLYHLNHYAKSGVMENEFYFLKTDILEKFYKLNFRGLSISYIRRGDKKRIIRTPWYEDDENYDDDTEDDYENYDDDTEDDYDFSSPYMEIVETGYYDLYSFKIEIDDFTYNFCIPIGGVDWIKEERIQGMEYDPIEYARSHGREITEEESKTISPVRIAVEMYGFLYDWKWEKKARDELRDFVDIYREIKEFWS